MILRLNFKAKITHISYCHTQGKVKQKPLIFKERKNVVFT